MSKNPLSWLLVHAPACAPDAGFTELPQPSQQRAKAAPLHVHRRTESAPLLGDDPAEDCLQCARKKRRASFDAYPTVLPTLPEYVLQPRKRPRERGCRRIWVELKRAACFCTSKRRYQLISRYRYSKQKKPYTAISVHVEQLTSENYEEDDLAGIPDLLEVVKLQATGPTEVARALRKKLKYGSVHRQLRALTILDGLLQNGGQRLQRQILSDPPLQERLRIAAIDPISDQDVRTKCKTLFGQWVASSAEQPGLEGAKSLYNQLPKKRVQPAQQRREQSKVLRETEEEAQREQEAEALRERSSSIVTENAPSTSKKTSRPIALSSSSAFGTNKVKKDKKLKTKYFNIEKEKPAILQAIAGSSVAASNLNNALKLVNREDRRVSEDPEVMKRFETCKALRRQILRYIQFVETEELLGGLIDANERLIEGLMGFEVMDKSVDDDSDSEMEEAAHLSRKEKMREDAAVRDAEKRFADMSVAPSKPPRPASIPMPPRPAPGITKTASKKVDNDESDTDYDSDDSDDPFADRNAAPRTPDPTTVRTGYTWKEI